MQTTRLLSFPPFHLDVDNEQLRRDDTVVPLRHKAFAVLRYLAEHPERLVNREELVRAVWDETKVSEGVLRGCLREIRQALGDSVETPQFIETVGRQGWRFIETVVSSQHSVASSQKSEPASDSQPLTSESIRQETEPTDLYPPIETTSPPVAINGLPQTDGNAEHLPVDTQPHGEALNDAAQAKNDTAPLPTDVQPLEWPSPLQPVNKNRQWKTTFVVMGLLLVGGVVATLYLFPFTSFWEEPTLPLPDKPSLVVLPFANLSGDPEQDYFSDGITADLTSDLSQVPNLFVIARNSAFTYKSKAVKAQQVSRELGVRYVIEGNISKTTDRLRIRVQLIDATTGFFLWSERYDRELKDLFAIQDEVTRKIVTTLALQLPLWEKGWAVRKRTYSMEAYDTLLRGVNQVLLRTKEANTQARQLFEKAIALDPQYAWAYVSVADTYFTAYLWGWDKSPQALEQAFAFAQQAIALDASIPTAHSVLSWIYLWKKQPQQAIAAIEQALALDPNNADSYARQAYVLNTLDRAEEALSAIELAMRLNPRYPSWYLIEAGTAYRLLWRQAEAIRTLKTLLSREPNYLAAYMQLSLCYLQQYGYQLSPDPGTLEQALEAARRIVSLSSVTPWWGHLTLGGVYLWQKHYERAIAAYEQAIALNLTYAQSYAYLAEAFIRSGRVEEATQAIEKALHLDPLPRLELYFGALGTACYFLGRSEEAIAFLKSHRLRNPRSFGSRLYLAALYAELGREEEAREEAAELMRINPRFSLEVYRQRVPLKDPAMLERHIAALRKAGLR
jgi:TolB-like protein/DNA-binding winged helix-turn-helix (wHTH) protein/Flp pilus assembly protein TadD